MIALLSICIKFANSLTQTTCRSLGSSPVPHCAAFRNFLPISSAGAPQMLRIKMSEQSSFTIKQTIFYNSFITIIINTVNSKRYSNICVPQLPILRAPLSAAVFQNTTDTPNFAYRLYAFQNLLKILFQCRQGRKGQA